MEEQLEDRIKTFLAASDGYGDGDGYGSGDGDGSGDGSGYGDGYGDGSGSGSGSGYGYGYGYGYGDGSGDGDGSGYGDGDGYGSGSGSGYGYGYGDGDGSGYGDGDGDGSGSGYGYGDGDGDGSGDGSGVPEFNGQKVWMIDNVPTIIDSVHDGYAKGSILNSDFTLTPCFIAKVDNCFAHGDTLRKAVADVTAKALERMPIEDRIARFKEKYPDPDVKIPARQLYDWHHTLTGSCEMGRNQFAREHNIDIDKDSFTVREFLTLTWCSYGFEAIRKVAEAYGIEFGNNDA